MTADRQGVSVMSAATDRAQSRAWRIANQKNNHFKAGKRNASLVLWLNPQENITHEAHEESNNLERDGTE